MRTFTKSIALSLALCSMLLGTVIPAEAFIGLTNGSTRTKVSGAFIQSETADIWVANSSGATRSAGSLMVVATLEDDGYRVDVAGDEGEPGLCFLLDDCDAAGLCLCRQHGFHAGVQVFDEGVGKEATAGECIYASGGEAGATHGLRRDATAQSGFFPQCLGRYLDSGTNASVEAYINIR